MAEGLGRHGYESNGGNEIIFQNSAMRMHNKEDYVQYGPMYQNKFYDPRGPAAKYSQRKASSEAQISVWRVQPTRRHPEVRAKRASKGGHKRGRFFPSFETVALGARDPSG